MTYFHRYDCLKESPYSVTEIVRGGLWKVTYHIANGFISSPEAKQQAKTFQGIDPGVNKVKGDIKSKRSEMGKKINS